MTKSNALPCSLALALVALTPTATLGGADVGSDLMCPAQVTGGTQARIDLRLENYECSPVTVRVISSIAGNSGQTLASVGIYGPQVIDEMRVLPGGTQPFGGCVAGFCEFTSPQQACTLDSQCPFCGTTVPSVTNLSIDAEPAVPSALSGTVATLIVVTEADDGQKVTTEVNSCLVEVL